MFSTTVLPLLPAHAAMLLVLLPTVGGGPSHESVPERKATDLLLRGLQLQFGNVIRVLRVDKVSHPAVVHAFDGRSLPAFVLLQGGRELFRQQGLPAGAQMAELLLSKVAAAA